MIAAWARRTSSAGIPHNARPNTDTSFVMILRASISTRPRLPITTTRPPGAITVKS